MAWWRDPDYVAFWLAIAGSDLAGWLQLTPYAYAVVEGLHLAGISFFFGSIFLLDLRLLGVVPQPATARTARFLLGIIVTASLTAGLFFLKFWRATRDPLFLAFSLALTIEGLNRTALLLVERPNEASPGIYVVRLLAFLLILGAIAWKNRRV